MSNLVITVIAMGIMALAVAMVAYYLGSTYTNGSSGAVANTTLNEASQIAGSWQNFMVGNFMVPPADWIDLIEGGYMEHVVQYPASVGTPAGYFQIWPDNELQHYYLIADLGDPVQDKGNVPCNRVLSAATGAKILDDAVPAPIPDFTAATLNGITRFTCGPVVELPTQAGIPQTANVAVFPNQLHNLLIYRLS